MGLEMTVLDRSLRGLQRFQIDLGQPSIIDREVFVYSVMHTTWTQLRVFVNGLRGRNNILTPSVRVL